MFGKLLKQEIKATYKIFLMIFGAIVFISFANMVGLQTENSMILSFAMVATFFSIIAISIVFAVTVLQRYYNNLYGEEGYLMFTLPVKSWQIILSKFVSALIWCVLISFVSIVCCFFISILVLNKVASPFTLSELYREVTKYIELRYFIITGVLLFVSVAAFIMKVYFVISFSNLPFIRRFHVLIALIVYFILGRIETGILNLIIRPMFDSINYYSVQDLLWLKEIAGNSFNISIFITILFIAVYFVLTAYITSHKLHLK